MDQIMMSALELTSGQMELAENIMKIRKLKLTPVQKNVLVEAYMFQPYLLKEGVPRRGNVNECCSHAMRAKKLVTRKSNVSRTIIDNKPTYKGGTYLTLTEKGLEVAKILHSLRLRGIEL